MMFLLRVLLILLLYPIMTTGQSNNCAEVEFKNLNAQALGEKIELKYVLLEKDKNLCVQLISTDETLDWISMGFTRDAETPAMVSSPSTTALVYSKSFSKPTLYGLASRSSLGVSSKGIDQDMISIISHSTLNGQIRVVFERPLDVRTSSQEVTLKAEEGSTGIIWAHGTSWPISGHTAKSRGSLKINLKSGMTSTVELRPELNLMSILSPIVLVFVLVVLGWINRTILARPKVLNQLHIARPAKSLSTSSLSMIIHTLTMDIVPQFKDLVGGELVMIVIVALGYLVVILASKMQYEDSPLIASESVNMLVTGNAAVFSLVLVFVFRIPIWEPTMGIGHDRMIKYHRIIARVFFVFSTVHLIQSFDLTLIYPDYAITSSEPLGNQQVKPVFGFVAYLVFTSLSLLAVEWIRRRFYTAFVDYHRFASTAGLVVVMFHCQTVQLVMIFPIVLIGFFFFQKGKQVITNHFYCTMTVDRKSAHPTTAVLTLPVSEKTTHWAKTLNPGSYFLLNLPQVSKPEFHPYTAVVSPDGKTIGFAIKSNRAVVPSEKKESAKKQKATFSSKVLEFVTSPTESRTEMMEMRLMGPYGRLSIDLSDYTELILIAGGIGITPLLSMLNQAQMEQKSKHFSYIEKIQVLWTVKYPEDLLCCDTLMFPTEIHLSTSGIKKNMAYFVSQDQEDGVITSSNGMNIPYRAGRPNLSVGADNVFDMSTPSTEKYSKTAICACGPEAMVIDAQRMAHELKIDFHKETFLW